MMPSLQVGDTFFAIPQDGARPLRRGDVVAFRDPHAAGAATATIAATLRIQENMPEITVPPGHHFMLGDSRLNSQDSRFASLDEGPGMPATTDIIGRVSLIHVPSDPARIGTQP